ncbi:hypothetical protein AQJ11_03340 [Streptomyces corchorusii]|uniref:Uncharacterized protein n=2 Tax=Streptomyces TaxID=1883 RepID=A0A101QMH5_STRCK|nr:DUF6302 family protein [Streptomyces corchorusii]KUN32573.1 hypothetical protein AQJ11_03340 [Streptomyces corchorusii]
MKHRPTLRVEVREPDRRDEWELSWYRERLADPTLLDYAVVIVVDGTGYLVVPRCGRRRGGYVSANDAEVIWHLCDQLRALPRFPDVRVRWSTDPDVCHAVEWGDPVPNTPDDRVRGKFYGYSDEAIAEYAEEVDGREQ